MSTRTTDSKYHIPTFMGKWCHKCLMFKLLAMKEFMQKSHLHINMDFIFGSRLTSIQLLNIWFVKVEKLFGCMMS